MRNRRSTALLLVALFTAIACDDATQVDVYLVRSPDIDEDPLVPGLTTDVRFRISGPGMTPQEIIAPYEPGGAAQLAEIPLGADRIFTVEGLKSDGLVLSRGRSLPIDIDRNTDNISLLIARVGRFSYAPGNGLETGRFGYGAAVTQEGELVLIGGSEDGTLDAPTSPADSMEIYNPTDGSVRAVPCDSRCAAASGTFGNLLPLAGGLLMTPGITESQGAPAFLETETFSVAPLTIALEQRDGAAGVSTLHHAIIAGGQHDDAPTDTVEVIDETFTVRTLSLSTKRRGLAGAGTDETAVFFGGLDAEGHASNDVFVIDPAAGSVRRFAADLEPRADARACSLADNRVLLIGGENEDGSASDSVDLVDPFQDVACRIGSLKIPVRHAAATLLPDGRVLVVGGLTGGGAGTPISAAAILDPRYIELSPNCIDNSGTLFTTDIPPTGTARYAAEAHSLPNGTVAVTGGIAASGKPVRPIEIFVPEE